ncbi:MAG: hypothetical protein KAY65_13895 [Planctomycetes bacterium]|nr:hypothetical protein [Planctomycetota bacterium]
MNRRRRRTIGLVAFLKGSTDPKEGMPGCANYDHHYGGCLFAETCLVQQGRRCSYFERLVLPTAADIGLRDRVYSQYEAQCDIDEPLSRREIRRCPDCGGELGFRQRYCTGCSGCRRRKTYRRSRQRKPG